MDWNKAKNIFIAMFLIINIFLSYQLYTISRNQYIYIDERELQDIKQYLGKKNVRIDAAIADRVLIAPSLKVKYHEFDIKKIEDIFFDSTEYVLSNRSQGFHMKGTDISVDVSNGYDVSYQNKAIHIKQIDVNEEKCITNAYNFINKLQLNTGNQFTKAKEIEKGYVRLVLGQEYNKIAVDSSQIEIIVTEEGVVEAKVNWLEWIKPDKRYNVITPVMALLKAYGDRSANAEATVVKQIRQGYYYTPAIPNDSSDELVLEGSLAPMWVIKSDKTEIYINAYNENFEKVK